jgi:hypothetical protein
MLPHHSIVLELTCVYWRYNNFYRIWMISIVQSYPAIDQFAMIPQIWYEMYDKSSTAIVLDRNRGRVRVSDT